MTEGEEVGICQHSRGHGSSWCFPCNRQIKCQERNTAKAGNRLCFLYLLDQGFPKCEMSLGAVHRVTDAGCRWGLAAAGGPFSRASTWRSWEVGGHGVHSPGLPNEKVILFSIFCPSNFFLFGNSL